jgi:hypothetical protein
VAAEAKNMTPIQSFAHVPPFANEDEEAAFWATHVLGEEILESMGPLPEGWHWNRWVCWLLPQGEHEHDCRRERI